MFSNISLTCRIDDDGTCPQGLFWFLDNKTTPLEDGEKYKIEERETHTQCKIDFILTIFNVTENDEGRYSCHWVCEYEETKKAAIDLKVFVELSPTGNNLSIFLCQILQQTTQSNSVCSLMVLRACYPRENERIIIVSTRRGWGETRKNRLRTLLTFSEPSASPAAEKLIGEFIYDNRFIEGW